MNMNRSIAAALSVTMLLSYATPVYAQGEARENWRQAREEFKNREFGQARADSRCAYVTARINNRIQHFNNRKEHHLARYRRIRDRVRNFVERLDEKGYDTGKIKTDLVTLDGKIQKAATDYATFIAKLEATRQYDCADSGGAFVRALKEARNALAVVKGDMQDIRDFIKNTLKPDVKNLKGQNINITPGS